MSRQEAVAEYERALKLGQREFKERTARGLDPHPAVLDDLIRDLTAASTEEIPLAEIPLNRVIGTKSGSRTNAFTASFLPLLPQNSEFGQKWISLCAAHLSDKGIQNPIECFEYLGNFYVQEGNKRVSVLNHFGALRISAKVTRILPPKNDEPRIVAYYEFLNFYRASGIYDIQFTKPGDYAKLLAWLGKVPGQVWTESEERTFRAYFQYFRDAFFELDDEDLGIEPEQVLLLWLEFYSFDQLGKFTSAQLKKTLSDLWSDVIAMADQVPIQLETEPKSDAKASLLTRILSPSTVQVAFIHQRDAAGSKWVKGHEEGRAYLEEVLGDKVSCRSYFHADSPEAAEELLELAVAEGAQLVFTTTPQLGRATLKAAVKYPKVRFLNCSVDVPYPSLRTYYSRIYEGKFITGAIAGAMAQNDRIGYVATYPIFGVPASINAFALGAQMTNPRAKIELKWSCLPGIPIQDLIRDGIRVISNRNVPTSEQMYLEFGDYGTYMVGDNGTLTPLGSPCWLWGRFYENVVNSILNGTWEQGKDAVQPVNYWWGMKSGVIDVTLSEKLPPSLLQLADILRQGLKSGTIDPFRRAVIAQDGSLKCSAELGLTPDELLRMDWLCDNVIGSIPEYEDVLPFAQSTVQALGLHRDRIPVQKEDLL